VPLSQAISRKTTRGNSDDESAIGCPSFLTVARHSVFTPGQNRLLAHTVCSDPDDQLSLSAAEWRRRDLLRHCLHRITNSRPYCGERHNAMGFFFSLKTEKTHENECSKENNLEELLWCVFR
jgi:hypothetical protein